MAHRFPSEEWVAAYREALNSSPEYEKAAATWDKGVVALVVKADPDLGIDEDLGVWLDLHKGKCREAMMVDADKAATAPFTIYGEYGRWKQVIQKELDPIKGMMQGKLKLKGHLPTIVREVKAAKELVNNAASVETEFLEG